MSPRPIVAGKARHRAGCRHDHCPLFHHASQTLILHARVLDSHEKNTDDRLENTDDMRAFGPHSSARRRAQAWGFSLVGRRFGARKRQDRHRDPVLHDRAIRDARPRGIRRRPDGDRRDQPERRLPVRLPRRDPRPGRQYRGLCQSLPRHHRGERSGIRRRLHDLVEPQGGHPGSRKDRHAPLVSLPL